VMRNIQKEEIVAGAKATDPETDVGAKS
jgi:hypothetical protein